MKFSIRKLIPIAAAIGLTFAASAASATTFTLKDGSGGTIVNNATSLDWNERGSGVAIGAGPFSDSTLLPVGSRFNFLYQANLASVSGDPTALIKGLDNTSNGNIDPGSAFEFTIVAKLSEVVTGSGVVGGKNTAFFGLGGGVNDNKVAIYYDTKMNANTTAGTGFADGTMIALLSIVADGTTSNFSTLPGTGTGQGSARIHAVVDTANGDFINAAFLDGVEDLLFGINFESNLNFPSGTSSTSNFFAGSQSALFNPYAVSGNDIIFKVDGANTFTNVPEPGSMMLMGLGMLGLVGAARRKSKKA
jgi:hypothetical protein